MNREISKTQRGFSILELLISVAVFSLVMLMVASFLFWLNSANTKAKAQANSLENARRILDVIGYEIRGAKSVYTPTTGANQLSLETLRYLPADEAVTFIDFFLCKASLTDICLKKESQAPIVLNTDAVRITALSFSQVMNGSNPSMVVSLTVEGKNPGGTPMSDSSVTLGSTISLRNY